MEIHAGFWRRVAAYLLDSLVLLIPSLLIGYVAPGSIGGLAQILLWAAYKISMESGESQATLGKKWMGIKVTDADGERIGVGQATGRFFGTFVSAIILGLGFVLAGITGKRQALHDLMASTLVVNATATPDEARDGEGTMPMTAGVWIAVVIMGLFPFGTGMLAAIAIPAYQDYVTRSKVSVAVMEGSQWKSEVHAGRGELVEKKSGSPYVENIVLDKPRGRIQIFLRPIGSQILSGATVTLALDADGQTWSCSAEGVPNRYLSPQCRN